MNVSVSITVTLRDVVMWIVGGAISVRSKRGLTLDPSHEMYMQGPWVKHSRRENSPIWS